MKTPIDHVDVLVVDDDPVVAAIVEEMLRELGYSEIRCAAGVQDALTEIEQRRPGVAILDLNLAGQPVYPVAEELAARGVPFIFASGYGEAGVGPAWTNRPAIQKPFRLDALATKIESVLESV